jgi:hypothetical protein
MKSVFIFFLLSVLTLTVGCKQTETHPIKIKLNLEKEYTKTIDKDEYRIKNQIEEENLNVKTDSIVEHYYNVKIDIENTGEEDLYIWMMTCSWYNNFKINNNYISFYSEGCNSNFPVMEKIELKSKISYNATFRKKIKFDYPNEVSIYGKQVELTKVGLIIIDDIYKPNRKTFDYFLNMEDKSKQKVIWSNGIKLLKESDQN